MSLLKIREFVKKHNLFLLSTYVFAFSFSLTPFFTSLSFFAFAILSVFHFKRHYNNEAIKTILLMSSLFFLYLLGLCYTLYIDRSLKLIIRVMPMVIIPAIIVTTKLYKKINFILFKKYFVFGVFTSCVISIVAGIYNIILHQDVSYLFYYKFGYFLHIHPTYYSFFVLVALVFFFQNKFSLILRLSIFIVLSLVLFLLQSKVAVISYFIVLITFVLHRKDRLTQVITVTFSITLIIFLSTTKIENIRYKEFFKSRNKIEMGSFEEDGISQRKWLWTEAISQIKEKPILGYGLGAQSTFFRWKVHKDILESDYPYYYSSAIMSVALFNLHNQYLQVFYEFGVVGIFVFVVSIILLLIKGVKKKKYLYLTIYLLFLMFLITENMLERQMGVYFYSFILTILYFEKD